MRGPKKDKETNWNPHNDPPPLTNQNGWNLKYRWGGRQPRSLRLPVDWKTAQPLWNTAGQLSCEKYIYSYQRIHPLLWGMFILERKKSERGLHKSVHRGFIHNIPNLGKPSGFSAGGGQAECGMSILRACPHGEILSSKRAQALLLVAAWTNVQGISGWETLSASRGHIPHASPCTALGRCQNRKTVNTLTFFPRTRDGTVKRSHEGASPRWWSSSAHWECAPIHRGADYAKGHTRTQQLVSSRCNYIMWRSASWLWYLLSSVYRRRPSRRKLGGVSRKSMHHVWKFPWVYN